MIFNASIYTIDINNQQVQLHCTVAVLDRLFDTFNVDFDTLDTLFKLSDTRYIICRIQKMLQIMSVSKNTQIDIEGLTETELINAITVITKCLYSSLPSDEDIPAVKHTDSKNKTNKKKQKITLLYIVYIATTVLGININTVKCMTVKQIIQLYGQHLLYNLGADEDTTINDMIPM